MGSLKNLIGHKFGKLTVISRNYTHREKGVYWNCICDCGNSKISSSQCLKKGYIKNCGVSINHKIKDITGQKFGQLLVESSYKATKKVLL